MPTTKRHTTRTNGAVTAHVDIPSGRIVVIAEDRHNAEVTIATADDDGSSADAVNNARIDENGDKVSIRVDHAGSGGTTVIQSGRGMSIIQTAGVVRGNMTGLVIGSGGSIHVGGSHVIVGGSEVVVTVRVPEGSSLKASTQSGDVDTTGRLERVEASTQSGDITVGRVSDVSAKTMSGDVEVAHLLDGMAELKSMSGDIRVHGTGSARASTMSGDVRGSGGVRLDGKAMSGRVRNS